MSESADGFRSFRHTSKQIQIVIEKNENIS